MNKFLNRSLFSFLTILLSFSLISAQDAVKKTATGLYNEALTLLKTKEYDKGLELLEAAMVKATADENEKVAKLAKKNAAIAAYNIAKKKYKAKEYDAAIVFYKKGQEYNPKYSSNFSGHAGALNKKGSKSEAIDMYLKSIEIATASKKEKKIASAYKRMSSIISKLYIAKEYPIVVELGKKVLASKSLASVNYYVSRALLETGDNQGALDHANKAIEDSTVDGNVAGKYYIAKAKAYVALGNKKDAIAAYEMVKGEYLEQAQYQIKKLKG